MNVTLKHLRSFIEVARQGNFTRAAEALSVSQPALTIAIGQFEDEIGVRLFDRTTRRVRLTGEGEAFLPTAVRLLEDFDSALADIREVAERRRGRVGVAALPSVAVRLLPDLLARFSERYPGIQVHLHDDNASGVQERVGRRQVDFGLGSRWEPASELSFRPLMKDEFGLVCRTDHELARHDGPIAWRELAGHPFLGLALDTGIQQVLRGLKGLPETVRSPKYEVSNIATLGGMLGAGLGVTALPALAMPRSGEHRLVFRKLIRPVVHRELSLITRRGRSLSPAAQALRDLVVEGLSSGSPINKQNKIIY